jgi:hypothetical protein
LVEAELCGKPSAILRSRILSQHILQRVADKAKRGKGQEGCD